MAVKPSVQAEHDNGAISGSNGGGGSKMQRLDRCTIQKHWKDDNMKGIRNHGYLLRLKSI